MNEMNFTFGKNCGDLSIQPAINRSIDILCTGTKKSEFNKGTKKSVNIGTEDLVFTQLFLHVTLQERRTQSNVKLRAVRVQCYLTELGLSEGTKLGSTCFRPFDMNNRFYIN